MNDLVKLAVNGREYAGWTSIQITRSLEAIAGHFRLGLTERWPGQTTAWPILPRNECSVTIGSDLVLTGNVDTANTEFDAESHGITVEGRDRSGKLVDMAAVHNPGEWSGLGLDRLAAILAKPFGVSVTAQADVGKPIPTFKIQPGETAFESLDRACRMRGLLPISDNRGGIVLATLGQTRCTTALVQGRNVKAASLTDDITDRYHTYIVRGSQPGTDFLSPEQTTAVEGRATDAGVPADRVLVILAESSVDISTARKRAQWEATVRAARAVTVSVTVQGWRQADGSLWPVNGLVQVDLPWLRVSGEMLITELTYSLDENGTQTELTLRRRDAFLPQPVMPVAEDPLEKLIREAEAMK